MPKAINEANLLKTFHSICLQQRRVETKQTTDQFRKTLIQLFSDASDSEMDNLSIDVEHDLIGS